MIVLVSIGTFLFPLFVWCIPTSFVQLNDFYIHLYYGKVAHTKIYLCTIMTRQETTYGIGLLKEIIIQ